MSSKVDFKIIDSISAMPGNIYCKDKDGEYLWCNDGQLKTLGFTDIKQILGKTDFDLCEYETASKIRAVDLRVMSTGNVEVIEEEGVYGNLRATLSHKAPLKNANGEIIGIIGNSLDISSQGSIRKQLMKENYTKKTALDSILANLPAHIYWKNREGVILNCNDKQAASFGLKSAQDFIGKTAFDFVDQESAQRIHESDMDVIRNGTIEIIEEPVKINDKEHVFISHKAPFKDPGTGKIIGILGVSIDITRQKELEQGLKKRTKELAEALEEKKRFIRNINHEIRTPMQTIVNGPQALKDHFYETTDEEKMAFIQATLDASLRLNNLVTNLLDISKFQEGKFTLEFTNENIRDFLEESVQEFNLLHSDINIEIMKDVPQSILFDKMRLHQVLRNLITNSIRYGSQTKPIIISISNHVEDGAKYLKFSIKDEGIGIPEVEKFSVFEPFVEGKMTRTSAGGTGLGLTISREIVESHRGRIWVDDLKNGEVGARISFIVRC